MNHRRSRLGLVPGENPGQLELSLADRTQGAWVCHWGSIGEGVKGWRG